MSRRLAETEKPRVLIVEDELTSRIVLKTVLERNGYEVVEACDGIEGWNILQQPDAPDLVLLDWLMPGLDGIEVCRRARAAKNAQLPYIIMLTVKGKKQDIVAGLDAGANDYITKPYDINELRARINVGCRMVQLQAELQRTLEHLETLAFTDALTMIANRRAIFEILEREMARSLRTNSPLCISMLDLDSFKMLNDEFGHQAGDAVLKECVNRIRSILRPYDSIGRVGGEEFLIIIAESRERVKGLFERIRCAVGNTCFMLGAASRMVTVSQGIVQWNRMDSMDVLIRKADDALYQAKKDGGNQIIHPEYLESSVDNVSHEKQSIKK
jgi:two-component system, cell cycle response regulator